MAIWVVEFSNGGDKVKKIFASESTYSKEIIEFWELVNGEVSKSAKIWLSKSIFYDKNYPNLFFFIDEYKFRGMF